MIDTTDDYEGSLAVFCEAAAKAVGCLPHPDAIVRPGPAAKLLGVHRSTSDRWAAEGLLEKRHLGPNVAGHTLRALFNFIRSRPTVNPHPRALGVREYWRGKQQEIVT
jgi:hypothetical protein